MEQRTAAMHIRAQIESLMLRYVEVPFQNSVVVFPRVIILFLWPGLRITSFMQCLAGQGGQSSKKFLPASNPFHSARAVLGMTDVYGLPACGTSWLPNRRSFVACPLSRAARPQVGHFFLCDEG